MAARKPTPRAKVKTNAPKPKPVNRGQTRSSTVNKGQQGARQSMKARHTAPPNSVKRAIPNKSADTRSENAGIRRASAAGAAAEARRPKQVAVEPGGLAGFARGVSQNFARGAAELGRQVGSVTSRAGGGRTDPLATSNLGAQVNGNKGKSWINK